jgi:hypothetical protein
VKNPGFEDGETSWNKFACAEGDGITDKEKHSGKCSFKFIGKRGVNKGIHTQRVGPDEFKPPIPAGTPITISGWCKTAGTNFEGGDSCMSATVNYTDGTSSYIVAPTFPKVGHDWLKVTTVATCKKDVTLISLYGGLYYDQDGEAYFDDLFVGIGKAKVTYKVECPNLKGVKLYSEEDGLIKDSGALSAGTAAYDGGTVEAKLFDRFCVEAVDAAGKMYREYYPKTEEVAAVADGAIPIFTRFNREVIRCSKEETYTVILPKIAAGKQAVLSLKARTHFESIAGCCAMLQVLVNGKAIPGSAMIGKKERLTFADGRDCPIVQGASTFYLYYSPDCGPIARECSYYPVDIPNNDPYTFQFRVSDLVKEGENTITLRNCLPADTKDAPVMVAVDGKITFAAK